MIDLSTNELRSIETGKLKDLTREDFEFNPKRFFPAFACFNYQIVDLYIMKIPDIEVFKTFLEYFPTAFNIRIIYKNSSLYSFDKIKALINILNDSVYYFGMVFSSDSSALNSLIKKAFDWISVYECVEDSSDKNNDLYYKPKFLPTALSVKIGRENNLYHYSRLTMLLAEKIEIFDSEKNNIPKKAIKVCSDCEFREVCVDPREVCHDGEAYFYSQDCQYDPYSGVWKE